MTKEIDPRTLTVANAKQLTTIPDYAHISRRFLSGDHWQKGEGWIGPSPHPGEEGAAQLLEEIERAFTSRNVISEVISRHASGIMGREPAWRLVPRRYLGKNESPTAEEEKLADEAEAYLTHWWNERGIHALLLKAVETVLWAERSALRMYVPKGLLREGRNGAGKPVKFIKARDLGEALDLLYLGHPDVLQSAVHTLPSSMRPVGLYLYEEEPYTGAYAANNTVSGVTRMELCYLDGKDTVLRTVVDGESGTFHLNLGGRILMHQLERPPFITEQVHASQRAFNLSLSMVPRNVVTSGFLERVLLNAQMPGDWEVDEQGDRVRFIPKPYHTGAGTTNFVRGLDFTDQETGRAHITNPSVHWREPVDVAPSINAKNSHYYDILDECAQSHILVQSSKYASGKAREHSRTDYINSLLPTRTTTEQAGRWVLETALAAAEQFIGQPGLYTSKLRADFSCRPDYGPVTADERRAMSENVDKRIVARETAMYFNGIDDTDAENAKINEEEGTVLGIAMERAKVLGELLRSGVDLQFAARQAGYSEEEIKAVKLAKESEPEATKVD